MDGTAEELGGVAATAIEEDSTEIGDFSDLGITASTADGAGSLADFFPGGSRQSFQYRFPTLGTADTDMDTATAAVQAMGMAADTLVKARVKAMGMAAETRVKAIQNRHSGTET